MFTGIITSPGTITSAEQRGDLRLAIACDFANDTTLGESIAVNGACLTVVDKNATSFSVDLSGETLARTAAAWKQGQKVNLERALKLGDRLDGHMVTGHIDGIATVASITKQGDSHILAIDAPADLAKFIAEKGSVTLNGVSLTVNKVEGARFFVNIIPHTWQVTTLSALMPGAQVNIEIDMIARYVARLLTK